MKQYLTAFCKFFCFRFTIPYAFFPLIFLFLVTPQTLNSLKAKPGTIYWFQNEFRSILDQDFANEMAPEFFKDGKTILGHGGKPLLKNFYFANNVKITIKASASNATISRIIVDPENCAEKIDLVLAIRITAKAIGLEHDLYTALDGQLWQGVLGDQAGEWTADTRTFKLAHRRNYSDCSFTFNAKGSGP